MEKQMIEGHFGKLAIIMVGLPATGKSFTARNITRYLRWLGLRTRLFSVAHYRKQMTNERISADFFDPTRRDYLEKRTEIADRALSEMVSWLTDTDGRVAILDATNTQVDRRRVIQETALSQGVETIFIECVYSELPIQEHVRQLKIVCPEYAGVEKGLILEDFERRLNFYKPCYNKLGERSEADYSFIRLIDGNRRLYSNNVKGYLRTKLLFYLLNCPITTKKLYLCNLDEEGTKYSRIRSFLERKMIYEGKGVAIWTETNRKQPTDQIFGDFNYVTKPQLRAKDFGIVEGLSLDQIKQRFAQEYENYERSPYYYRYPRGESYHDVAIRLETVIMELEKSRQEVLIIAERSILQCIYAYYKEIANDRVPLIDLCGYSLIELEVKAYGVTERNIICRENSVDFSSELFHPFTEKSYQ